MTKVDGARACIYARVSTTRQAKHELSISDQIERAQQWCDQHGAQVVETVIEPGASAMDDQRPQFQQMISRATDDDRPFDIIVVHSLSRLFRNAMHFLQYRAMLKHAKVQIISITQAFGDDPAAELAIGMLALFDEYHSMENAKHVQRAMIKNAKLGFWNGQTPPLGYRTYEAARMDGKAKRKLEIEEQEAFVVRKVFELYIDGPAGSGPLGITRIAAWLNERGYKYRARKFHVSNIQALLRNSAYIGAAMYNKRNSRTGERRPQEDWVPIPVPPIIDEDTFHSVQAKLVTQRPTNTAARVTTTNNLLIGIAKCGCRGDGCGGGMTAATGKGGAYKYYACSNRARSGASVCRGRRIGRDKLDAIVIEHLQTALLAPDRLRNLLSAWLDHTEKALDGRREQLRQLRSTQTFLEAGIDRLFDLVAEGHLTAADERFAKKYRSQSGQLEQVKEDIRLLEHQLAKSERRITPNLIDAFAELMKKRLHDDDVTLRQFYVRALVDRVEVGKDEIRIVGATKALEHAVAGAASASVSKVRNIERNWRTRQDSNLWPLPSEGNALSS